ncbi:MAG: type II toxin-antitoxin system RelE/ParE family toxin [Cyanobacteria bacterium CRU_2_1]|nr:type II toxin-antitoxin system RelE/ParE family toxin [Cyanobacteria bacterium RU_5_0]NJR58485.1 type II toxin-antitoxin system RelE/ParE family toxin [Cyanobacteria bacterium CRU_2_1]NJR58517.1 type II toxin-antitoxin system RelE/ParE family toxin [Cyanobacteria bacterium CRU_2_1]
MNEYQITFARSARKELESLTVELNNRIFPKIKALATEPRPSGCTKLVGEDDLWRIRIGDYRVIYSVDDTKRVIDITLPVSHYLLKRLLLTFIELC